MTETPAPADAAELPAGLGWPDVDLELVRAAAREAYDAGLAEGWRLGYEHGARLRQTEWPRAIAKLLSGEPSLEELELRRWGPGGRERFGDPRPSDRLRPTRQKAAS